MAWVLITMLDGLECAVSGTKCEKSQWERRMSRPSVPAVDRQLHRD